MKTQLITISLLISSSLSAQISVNSTDFISVGDSYAIASSLTLTTNDTPGPNKIWNYATVDTVNGTEGFTVLHPDSTTNGSSFPGTNIAIIDGDGDISYYSKTATAYENNGNDDGNILSTRNPLVEYTFPLTYGNTNSDAFWAVTIVADTGATTPDSIRTTFTGKKNYTVDSWGDLILPTGTLPVLRIKDTLFISIFTEGLVGGVWTTISQNYDTSYNNVFVSNNLNATNEVLTQRLDRNGNVVEIKWLYDQPEYAGIFEQKSDFTVSLFPNPSINELNIQSKTNFNHYIIMDISGRLLMEQKGNSVSRIDISSLQKGNYILTLKNEEGQVAKMFVKQ